MEISKEKAIEQAYVNIFGNDEKAKKRFDEIKKAIDEWGWFSGNLYMIDDYFLDISGHDVRPKTLNGIEDNNGWKIVNSVEDMPDKFGNYIFWTDKGGCQVALNFDPEQQKQIAKHLKIGVFHNLEVKRWFKLFIPEPIFTVK